MAFKVLLGTRILVQLATYKLSLSALTGQTKCKQTQLLVASWTRIRVPSKTLPTIFNEACALYGTQVNTRADNFNI